MNFLTSGYDTSFPLPTMSSRSLLTPSKTRTAHSKMIPVASILMNLLPAR